MSRLVSLYMETGEADDKLSRGCCKVEEWAAQTIEDMQVEMLNARAIMLRWCKKDLSSKEIIELKYETLKFIGE
jgi:hypothetical protein